MSQSRNLFVEFHVLRSYAPGNLNRDELGTPKTAIFGDERRLRISSQCLKRTWRTSDFFKSTITDGLDAEAAERLLSDRTSLLPAQFAVELMKAGLSDGQIADAVAIIAKIGVKSKQEEGESGTDDEDDDDDGNDTAENSGDGSVAVTQETKHLLFISKGDRAALCDYFVNHASEIASLFSVKKGKKGAVETRTLISKEHNKFRKKLAEHMANKWTGVDIALFGRFVTSPEIPTVNAALQVAHALGTQRVEIEYDYFSAVDDVKETSGAGHIGESEFAASVFYEYAVCDWALLTKNLAGDTGLAAKSMEAVGKAIARAVPKGKKNGTAPQNPADYVEVVVRRDAPISLTNAFIKPVRHRDGSDVMAGSIRALRQSATSYAEAYSEPGDVVGRYVLCLRDGFDTETGETRCRSLGALTTQVAAALHQAGAAQ